MHKIFTLLEIITAHIFYWVGSLVPRSQSIYIFIGWHRNGDRQIFADNSKYQFLHTHHQTSGRAIWIAEEPKLAKILTDQGYESYTRTSLRGMYYALRAGTTVIDANLHRSNWQWSRGTRLLQLWHGKGFKKSGKMRSSRAVLNYFFAPEKYTNCDYTIASSPYTAKMMGEIMGVAEDQVLITGLPRNDVLFESLLGAEIDAHPALADLFSNTNHKKTILYAPTFRRWEDDPLSQLDLPMLQEHLKNNDHQLVLSFHPKYHARNVSLADFSHIHFIDAGYDLYPYLKYFDTVITDYSSIFLEFLLLDKHCIFFTYDFDRYQEELYPDYTTLTPGPHVTSTAQILTALTQGDKWKHTRAKIRAQLFTHQDGQSADRIHSYYS